MTVNEQSRAQAAARVEMIRPLAAEHRTAAQIASYLQMTKNQVVGLCYRHGVKLGSPERRQHIDRRRARIAAATKARAAITGVPLRERGCRWPAWGNEAPTHLYCGCDKDLLQPYCEDHMIVAYRRDSLPSALR